VTKEKATRVLAEKEAVSRGLPAGTGGSAAPGPDALTGRGGESRRGKAETGAQRRGTSAWKTCRTSGARRPIRQREPRSGALGRKEKGLKPGDSISFSAVRSPDRGKEREREDVDTSREKSAKRKIIPKK